MKRCIILIAFLAAGCVKDRDESLYSRARVVLDPTTTRATATTLAILQRDGFTVYATDASTSDWFGGIDGSNAHTFSDAGWDFTDPVMWPTDGTLYPLTFYSLYPDASVFNSVTATASPTVLQASYTVPAAGDDQKDLLSAVSSTTERPVNDMLAITFQHILSKIVARIDNPDADVLQTGVMNVLDTRTFDFVAQQWLGTPTASVAQTFYMDSMLMLMPQTTAAWVPVAGSAPTSGALIHATYRLPGDEVGYATAADHPSYAGGYTGPLYARVGFPVAVDWTQGKGYTYNITVGEPGISNGYLIDGFYYDDQGNRTTLPVRDGRRVGEMLNDGVIHIALDVDEWDEALDDLTPPDSNPLLINPEAPYIVYWDATSGTMQVGSWNAVTGGAVKTENQLEFKFGGLTGFLNQNDAWDASDIKFALTTETVWANLPSWKNYTGMRPTTDGYISSDDYHNADNVAAGRGDPCKLVGLTLEQINNGIIDNGQFRLPTIAENGAVANWTITGGALPAAGTLNTTRGITRNADGIFLPASGSRNTVGNPGDVGRNVYFWTSGAGSTVYGRVLYAYTSVQVNALYDATQGLSVRCVRTTPPYSVTAAADAGGAATVTHGATPITQSYEYESVTFTATPATGHGFLRWTLSDAGAALLKITPSDLLKNPLTIPMPAGDLTATASFGDTWPVGQVTIPAAADGTGGAIWATVNLANNKTFAASTTDTGAYFQWGRNVAWVHPDNGMEIDPFPEIDTDQTGATEWSASVDPCPTGWHVPTTIQWQRFHSVVTDPLNTGDRTFASARGNLTLPAAGYIGWDGEGQGLGTQGWYWSRISETTSYAYYDAWSGTEAAHVGSGVLKNSGFPVRCVREIPVSNPVGYVPLPSADGTYTTLWAKTNLADVGTFADTEDQFGAYFQWGRVKSYYYDWPTALPAYASDQAVALWPETQNPCPAGWRVPTIEEWYRLMALTDEEPMTPLKNLRLTSQYGNITFPASGYNLVTGRGEYRGQAGLYPSVESRAPFSIMDGANYWNYSGGTYSGFYVFMATSNSSGIRKDQAIPMRCVRTAEPNFTPNPVGEVEVNGTIWAMSNLSDYQVFATSATGYGCFFQWGWHNAITGSSYPHSTAQSATTWPDSENPCPRGWRVPTAQQFMDLIGVAALGQNGNVNGPYTTTSWTTGYGEGLRVTSKTDSGKTLLFHNTGGLDNGTNTVGGRTGWYWSSEQDSAQQAYYLLFHSSLMNGTVSIHDKRQYAQPVRCVRTQ